ncbi:MAG: RagB/SusD family nutrient uptake outer membrane protein [Paludibacter sp.]|nr:RagB/SusD family nutrient uptake outer membrane protein [Paludibacter sp.]MDD4199279.1 RagB/SusD family nutrient uptake outer membrane protein [Paludibacter sp.]MDD4428413.1 RagB/SusD family nutrient uptake outer membrane protein [Paludibacter sp.]
MKSIKRYIHGLALSLLLVLMVSCEDFAVGEKFLQKPPSTDVTIDTIFSTAEYARKVLWYSYSLLPYEFPTGYNFSSAMWYGILEGLSDLNNSYLTWDGVNTLYYSGSYNAGSEDATASNGGTGTKYRFTNRNSWKCIRHAWILIENIDRVPDMSAAEKNRLKAEAKIIIATQYAEMIRHYGSLPIVDRAIDPEDVNLPKRATLQETVNFIVRLLDEAKNCSDLPWAINESESDSWSGRLTRASAMGLKTRVLLFVASPLFNSETPYYAGEASDKLMTWFGGYDEQRWKDAAKAGEEFIAKMQQEGFYDLVKTGEYRMAFRDGYFTRGTTESLISSRRHYRTNNIGALLQSARWGAWCPTKEYFDMFPMSDGSDFDWNNTEHAKNPFINRDPRLCETILLDGDKFGSSTADVCKEKSSDKINYPKGADWGKSGVLDNTSLSTGIAARKFVLDRQGEYKNSLIHWPYLRLAEIYLSYAEALNEVHKGPNALAYQYVNEVRARVGLGGLKQGLNQQEFREAVLRERACEFGYEEVRFFDLIRWKREADFTKRLHGINVYRHRTTGEYQFEFPKLKERAWQKAGEFSPKWYLSAFPPREVNKGYGLVQNPGWE